MSTAIREVFTALIDDAAVFPPGNASLSDAVAGHRRHRVSWYERMVGPLLIPASRHHELPGLLNPAERRDVGLVGDQGLAGLDAALAAGSGSVTVRQVELAVAKRGQDPLPGLRSLLQWRQGRRVEVYAELPLSWGCIGALDLLAEAPGDLVGDSALQVLPKFRTGGLAAELFPSPRDLAAVIVACAQRGLRFKLTAGLHHAIRHTDPTTGFAHHGFLNVLAACEAAMRGEPTSHVAELLAVTIPEPLLDPVRDMLDLQRPLWVGFGACSIAEPLDDLVTLGLVGQ